MAAPAAIATPTIAQFDHAVVCALPKERLAVELLLDSTYSQAHAHEIRDVNVYTLGRIGGVNLVVCSLPAGEYGKVSATTAAKDLLRTYTAVRHLFFVGIAGACPDVAKAKHKLDLRLGDVVTSVDVVLQYDLGKALQGGAIQISGHLNMPGQYLRNLVSALEQKQKVVTQRQQLQATLDSHVQTIVQQLADPVEYSRPQLDELFDSACAHQDENLKCSECCVDGKRVDRPARPQPTSFRVHLGKIGCGDMVVKDSVMRDRLMKEHGLACFEMEAAAVAQHGVDYLIIRGMCDYADSHKNKEWQGYACATAAAVFKEIILAAPAPAAAPPAAAQTGL